MRPSLDPFITVAVPTFRRPDLLRRAVRSVLDQTESDWELVVSDDEDPPGASWQFLQRLARSDSRVKALRNSGPHGQVGNTNRAMLAGTGTWIKLLHDDDVMRPRCLELLAKAVRSRPGIVSVSCADEVFCEGRCVRPFRRRDRRLLEEITPGNALLAMYVLDEAGWGRPSQGLVHRSVIDAGVLFEQPPGIVSLVDSWWNARVRGRGASLVYNLPLVEWHCGCHESITTGLTVNAFDIEYVNFRELVLPLIPSDMKPPSLRTTQEMVRLIRILWHARKGHLTELLKLPLHVWSLHGDLLAMRWILRQLFPRRFSDIERTVVWP